VNATCLMNVYYLLLSMYSSLGSLTWCFEVVNLVYVRFISFPPVDQVGANI